MNTAPTFYSLKPGDIIYYVTMEKSRLIDRDEIKSSVISEIKPTGNIYEFEITLNNGVKFRTNWNSEYHKEDIINEESRKYQNYIVKPFFCKIFATDKKMLKEIVQDMVETSINNIISIQDKLQSETIRLSGLRLMANLLQTKKVEELVAETVIV